MALHILQQQGPTTGEKFGQSLATGLGALAQGKIQQLQARNQQAQTAKAFEGSGIEGITPQIAQNLARMSPEDRKLVLKHVSEANFSNKVSQAIGIQTPGITNTATQEASQAVGIQPQAASRERSEFEVPPPPIMKPVTDEEVAAEKAAALKQEKAPTLESLAPQMKKLIEGGYPLPKNQKEFTDLFKEAHKANIEEKNLAFKEKKFTADEIKTARKETEALRKEAYVEEKDAEDKLESLGRLKELSAEGLSNPSTIESLKNLGLDIPAFLTDPTQEAQKIIQSFSRDIGKSFKGSISQFELEQFMATIPNLLQSPEGFKRVIAQFDKLYRLKYEYGKQMRKASQENKGANLEELEDVVNERMKPIREKIKEKWREDLKRKVPDAENAFSASGKIGSTSLLGKIAPKLGSAIAHAAIGAAYGSTVPGLGTVTGGGLGALYGLFK